MIDFQVAYDKLASMESADEIAEFFKDQGVKGFRCKAKYCPISNWMRDTTGQTISTDPYAISIVEDDNKLSKIVFMTEAMQAFVVRFDSGTIPELDVMRVLS